MYNTLKKMYSVLVNLPIHVRIYSIYISYGDFLELTTVVVFTVQLLCKLSSLSTHTMYNVTIHMYIHVYPLPFSVFLCYLQ